MDYEKIIGEITNGLSGDAEEDIKYLQEQMERYKNHEMGKEIIRACGRMIYDLLPDDKKSKIDQFLHNDFQTWYSVLDEVRFNRYKKNNDKALQLIESLVTKADDMTSSGMFADDAVSEYHCFSNPMESILYIVKRKSEKEIRYPSGFPFDAVYLEYGSLLVDFERIEDARTALEKARKWNPASAMIAFEYAETFKMLGDIETFFSISLETFSYAYTSRELARCYRNIGFYFIEKELWKEAIGCFIMSLQFDKSSTNAQAELYYINSKTEGKVPEPDLAELKKFGEQYGFPIGADENVLGIAYSLARKSVEAKDDKAIRFYNSILYDLTKDECFKMES